MDLWEALKQAQDGPVHVIRRAIGTMKVRYIKWTPNGLYKAEQVDPLTPPDLALPYSPAGDDMQAQWQTCDADGIMIGTVDGLAAQAPEVAEKYGCSIEDARRAMCQSIADAAKIGIFEKADFPDDMRAAADAIRILAEAEKILAEINSYGDA